VLLPVPSIPSKIIKIPRFKAILPEKFPTVPSLLNLQGFYELINNWWKGAM